MAYNPLVPGGRYGVHTFVENGRAMKQTCTGSVCTHEDHLKGMRKPTVPQQLPFGDPSLVNSLGTEKHCYTLNARRQLSQFNRSSH